MNLIPTTATVVEKLKKRAKAIKQAEGVPHLEALERAAQQAGYDNWHHVQWCLKKTVPDKATPGGNADTTKPTVADRVRALLASPLAEGFSIKCSWPRGLTAREFARAQRLAGNSSCLFAHTPPSPDSSIYSLEWSAQSLRDGTFPETGRADALRAILDSIGLSIAQIDASEKPVWEGKGNFLPQVAANLAAALGGEIDGPQPHTRWRLVYCKDYPRGVELVEVHPGWPFAAGLWSESEWAGYPLETSKETSQSANPM